MTSQACWELKVEGRLLDEQGAVCKQDASSKHKRKFSSFFKSLVIELDKELYGPDNHLVEWHRTSQTNETDGFQVSMVFVLYRVATGILYRNSRN